MLHGFIRACGAVLMSAAIAVGPVAAQGFPNRPIKIISPFAPGGNNDTGARLFAKELQERIGQPVVVENKPGAGGTIGTRFVASAAPDGYTLLFNDINSMTNHLNKNGLEDVFKELTPVSLMLTGPWVLWISTKHPVKTFDELVAYVKARPGEKLNLGATTTFSSLAMNVLKTRAGTDFYVDIPYKGTAPVLQALMAGEADLAFDSFIAYRPLLEQGKVRPLFVTRKSGVLVDVPTAAAAGVANFDPDFQGGIWAPAGTPKDVVAKLNAQFVAIAALPQVQERIRTMGSEPNNGSAEALRADAEAGIKFLGEATRLSNFKPE